MESRQRAEGGLAKVREDKEILHTSFVQLGSVVETKDEVIKGLQAKNDSIRDDLTAQRSQLEVER
jgi:capsule polysaccharide export protein KpsE/RkpR